MTRRLFIIFVLFPLILNAQSPEPRISFGLLRQDDEYKPAEGLSESSFYDKIKAIQLSNNSILSIGGSYRFQTEGFINQQFSADPSADDLWYLNRVMGHAHLKIDNKWDVFAELNSSFIFSKDPLSPVDKDVLAINQLFARYNASERLSFTLGRENVRLGSGRIVDIREGPNVRLSFDKAEVAVKTTKLEARAFFSVPVQQKEGYFDNDYLQFNEFLTGVYLTRNWGKKVGLDAYLLFKHEANKEWSSGTADDDRFSLGLRWFGEAGDFSYNNEFIVQKGKFGQETISAWTTSFDLAYTLDIGQYPYRAGVKTEAISGDNSIGDSKLNTFDGLYPRGAYFGRVALFGPSNLIDIHPYVNATWGRWSMMIDYVAFWRFSTEDASYGPPLNLQFPDTNDKRFIAHQFGTVTAFAVSQYLGVEVEANLVTPGPFLKGSDLDKILFHAVLTTEVRF